MTPENAPDGLRIRLLGELEISAQGRVLPLPPSKKTRALLGYLVLSQRAHRRERLCELLWDVADDPRAALRWSLTKLRELVDGGGTPRLRADREHVSLDLRRAYVDVLELQSLLGTAVEERPTAELEAARSLFRGELLEGLELPEFHGYYAWCVAERKLWRERHRAVLKTLLARAGGQPDKALPLVRELVHVDPLDEGARAQLLELLHASGKIREAEEQSRANRRLLSDSLPAREPAPAQKPVAVERRSSVLEEGPLVGRREERERIRTWFERVSSGARLVLIGGDPGVGKSRLARELVREAASSGARVVAVSVPELRLGLSYAPWFEVLHALGAARLDEACARELSPLVSPSSAPASDGGRERLFHATAAFLERVAQEVPRLLIAMDDVQWLDDASAELLHFVARSVRGARVHFLLTARLGELHDHPHASRLLRALRRDRFLEELTLAPLTREETSELVGQLPGDPRADYVYGQSAGNPLFALELSREARTDTDALPRSIKQLVRDRIDALPSERADVLRWASVLGTHFDVDLVSKLVSAPPEYLVDELESLERHGFLSLAQGPNRCSFSHELVRSSVYDQLSEPRRRLMHKRVATVLGADGDVEGALAATLAHHAALGGDSAMAARACVSAGRRSLRLFAHSDARALVRQGMRYAAELADPEQTRLSIELFEVRAYTRMESSPELLPDIIALTARALDLGLIAHARLGVYLRAHLSLETGRPADASHFSREAERISRLGDPRDRVRALADAARCAAAIERDLPDAEAFLLEAERMAEAERIEPLTMPLARGLLASFRGDLARAEAELDRARELARREGDRLEEYYSLAPRVDVALRRGRHEEALRLSHELASLGDRLRYGSEGPFARALTALCQYILNAPGADLEFAEGLRELALADAKQRRALLLVRAAQWERAQGAVALARSHAEEALGLARTMERASEAALALSVLVHAALSLEGRAPAEHLQELRALSLQTISAEAREAASAALAASGESSVVHKGKSHGARHRRTKLL